MYVVLPGRSVCVRAPARGFVTLRVRVLVGDKHTAGDVRREKKTNTEISINRKRDARIHCNKSVKRVAAEAKATQACSSAHVRTGIRMPMAIMYGRSHMKGVIAMTSQSVNTTPPPSPSTGNNRLPADGTGFAFAGRKRGT